MPVTGLLWIGESAVGDMMWCNTSVGVVPTDGLARDAGLGRMSLVGAVVYVVGAVGMSL